MSKEIKQFLNSLKSQWCMLGLVLIGVSASAQVKASVDSTTIKIGEALLYSLEVESDSTAVVVFPESQTFGAMEVIENYKTDTLSKDLRLRLLKKYGLTQFDSGAYTIPSQKILIGDKTFFSDSIKIEVCPVKVDTTKQKLYGIKPIFEVKNKAPFWGVLKWILGGLLIAGLVVWYFFVYRKKGLTEAEKIAALPPYEQAKIALEKLDEKTYFDNGAVKSFYSELSFVLRKYLNEKVYNQSLESTTEELLQKLKMVSQSKEVLLTDETLKNLELTLKRADLVKFAKSKPGFEIIRLDKQIIAQEIDLVKAGLPAPTEIELEQTLEYQKQLQKKQQQKRIKWGLGAFLGLFILMFLGSGLHFGFTTVKDTILRHPSKLLMEGKWVSSEYGAPGISLETPEVLGREFEDSLQTNNTGVSVNKFRFDNGGVPLKIVVKSSKMATESPKAQGENTIDLFRVSENELTLLEKEGASNMFPKNDKFTTPNGQEGMKTHGTANYRFGSKKTSDAEFIILGFSTQALLQQLIMIWDANDPYAVEISKRILNSVELIKLNQN